MFGFIVIKGDEFPEGDPRRKWKYRIVFQGNNVKDQDWQIALFDEMSSKPATLDASRISRIYSCFPDNSIEGRDVEQAYISAEMRGTPTWIVLPEELWTPEMKKMKCPVVKLEKALYGHKNSGAYWQEYCDNQCQAAGFELAFGQN